jgi:hypothetical protein
MFRSRRWLLGVGIGAWLFAAVFPVPAGAGEPSPAYKASLRRTLEKRRERRQARPAPPLGTIVPWPMPPALVIRQTPEVHDQIDDLLWLLRR